MKYQPGEIETIFSSAPFSEGLIEKNFAASSVARVHGYCLNKTAWPWPDSKAVCGAF